MEERVKIITPGTCDYFRKVLLPAGVGDEYGDYAPKNGAYKNAIVEYAVDGAVFLYSSDGIYTMLREGNKNLNFFEYFGIDYEDQTLTKAQYDAIVKFLKNYDWSRKVLLDIPDPEFPIRGVMTSHANWTGDFNNEIYSLVAYPFYVNVMHYIDDDTYSWELQFA